MEKELGLTITDFEVLFEEYPIGEIWFDCRTSSFKIPISEIKAIAISPRLAMDEEIFIISMIDKGENFYEFSSWECQKESFKQFEKRFGLNDIVNEEWSKFSWKEHQGYLTSKLLYPTELYWEDLFVKPKGYLIVIEHILKLLSIKKSVIGKLNPKIKEYLQK